jgi:NADPH-dependent 2,4-dienoyl-CoA reductase/sulfur reductase-like enzyme
MLAPRGTVSAMSDVTAHPMDPAHVIVVGASLAGLRAVETLRSSGFAGGISVVGAEPHLPYDRPPLSKKLLAGEWDADRIALRKPDDVASLDVTWHLGVAAGSLSVGSTEHSVRLADGSTLHGDGVIIATGAAVRRLPDQPLLDGVVELRTLDDALDLRSRFGDGVRLVVVGAGFIGLEAAATAAQRGCHVTVLEGLPAPLVRGLGADMGRAVASVHTRNGVDVRCGVTVAGIEGANGRVTGVRLGDGGVVAADIVLVAIGVSPSTGWLEGSGLEIRDGVVCDATLCAGPTGVYAAGDLARWPNPLFGDTDAGEEMRVEHWTNAAEQGAAAARNLLRAARGENAEPYAAVPFFWSDQFDAKIQFLGRAAGDDEVRVIAGDPTDGRFAALYGSNGRLRGALGVSMPKIVMPYRKLLLEKASWEHALAHAASIA